MRNNLLKVLALLVVVWSVSAVAPVQRADASPCACTLLCVIGKTCCATQLTGGCHQQCEDNGEPCPSICVCTIDCVIGKHCCTGITSEGVCTQTCIANGTACPH